MEQGRGEEGLLPAPAPLTSLTSCIPCGAQIASFSQPLCWLALGFQRFALEGKGLGLGAPGPSSIQPCLHTPPTGYRGHPLHTRPPLLTLRLCPNWALPQDLTGWGQGRGWGQRNRGSLGGAPCPLQGTRGLCGGHVTAPQQGPHHSPQEAQLEGFWGALHEGQGSEGNWRRSLKDVRAGAQAKEAGDVQAQRRADASKRHVKRRGDW